MTKKAKKKEPDVYVGPYKVIDVEKQEVKTHLGSDVVKVIYENQPDEIMPLKAFELLMSPVPVDLTMLQKRRFAYLIPKLIEQMMEIDVRMYELPKLMTDVHETLSDHFERASNYLWTGDDRDWSKGANFMNNRTIIETHKVLLDMDKDPNSHKNDGVKGNTSEDSGDNS